MRLVFRIYDYKEDWERKADFLSDFKIKIQAPFPLKYSTVKEWDTYLYHHPTYTAAQKDLACHNVKAFGFNIDTIANVRIKDFDEITELCKEKRMKLYFVIMPENTMYADSLVGKELVSLMEINKNILVNRYTRKGVTVIDNLKFVEGKDYIEQHHVSEHYNQKGRMKIAENIAKVLKKDYPGYYRGYDYSNKF